MASVYKRGGKSNRNGFYYAAWFDHRGKRQTKCTRTTDKADALRIANEFESKAALRREGIIDETLESINAQANRSIESHLQDYRSKLIASRRTERHIRSTINFINQACNHAGFAKASDISVDGVNSYAAQMAELGRAARTIQAHLNAITAFTRWLTETHKLPRNPLVSIKKPNPNSDRRIERRVLGREEWAVLEQATRNGRSIRGISGSERRLLYLTAIQTGFRANELRSLKRNNLFLSSDKPYITCKSESTKNSKAARQYVSSELAQELAIHARTKTPTASLLKMPDETDVAEMLRADLGRARKAWLENAKHDPEELDRRKESDFLLAENHGGEKLDFHALRHTCGAWLAKTGVHPKVVQSVMRHSSITLTMDTYGHLFPGQESEAIEKLGSMFGNDSMESALATGTDPIKADMDSRACSARRSSQDKFEIVSNKSQRIQDGVLAERAATVSIGDFREEIKDVPQNAAENQSSSGGIRTPDTRIMIPLL